MKKYIVLCPGNSVTGGPELLHQLVDSLNNKGMDASIIYYPLSKDYKVPKAYSHYNVKVTKYKDNDFTHCEVIIPEISTGYTRYFKNSKKHIWWMSVDNYFKYLPKDFKSIIKNIILYKISPIKVSKLHDCNHLAQSEYARTFLLDNNFNSLMLSDYLNQEHLNKVVNIKNKENIICYNPKKGVEVSTALIKKFTEYQFIAIQNMTSKQVSELLDRSKIYIDFGHHPGKDRLPREAAMADCVVITGVKGSAANSVDIPVPDKYKINEEGEDYLVKIGCVFDFVMNSFDSALLDFKYYKESIKSEKVAFHNQVEELIKSDYL